MALTNDPTPRFAYYNDLVEQETGLPLCGWNGTRPCAALTTNGTHQLFAPVTATDPGPWQDLAQLVDKLNGLFALAAAPLEAKARAHFDNEDVQIRLIVDNKGFHLSFATCEGSPKHTLEEIVKAGHEKLNGGS